MAEQTQLGWTELDDVSASRTSGCMYYLAEALHTEMAFQRSAITRTHSTYTMINSHVHTLYYYARACCNISLASNHLSQMK